ncbi:MAG: hypothetical protein K0Q97_2013 [Bacillota bacterium]|nr:hypothetical protein [Bacillota bacterium]
MTDINVNIEAGWNFDNSYTNLPESFFTSLNPKPVSLPKLVILNNSLAKSIGLNADNLKSDDSVAVFAGNKIPENAKPIAQAYAGHQFGYFTMLGDGRAILLGEQITPEGQRYDIQLKGSGRTPYSRGGDGRAALGPMLREYIISEAMHALKIPTTRSLAVVTTGEQVYRENELIGAILTRVAASHLRVGTFQYASNFGTVEDVKKLADYTLDRHYSNYENEENKYLYLLKEVIKRQAELISKWMLVGFIHGVMNTDNMTISGETIDYGPCAFMDSYDPSTVFSSIDRNGRYAYGNQPTMAGWNLTRFAETLLPLLSDNEEQAIKIAQETIDEFNNLYQSNWLSGMRLKLGFFNEEKEDESLIENLLNIMKKYNADFTNTFCSLTMEKLEDTDLFKSQEFTQWHENWQNRLKKQEQSKESIMDLMKNNNPAVIPRNHRVEEALQAANNGDLSVMEKLLQILSKPYAYLPDQVEYAKLPQMSGCKYKTFCGT